MTTLPDSRCSLAVFKLIKFHDTEHIKRWQLLASLAEIYSKEDVTCWMLPSQIRSISASISCFTVGNISHSSVSFSLHCYTPDILALMFNVTFNTELYWFVLFSAHAKVGQYKKKTDVITVCPHLGFRLFLVLAQQELWRPVVRSYAADADGDISVDPVGGASARVCFLLLLLRANRQRDIYRTK